MLCVGQRPNKIAETSADVIIVPNVFKRLLNWDHERLGKAYVIVGLNAGLIGIVLSLLIRAELRSPGIGVLPLFFKTDSSQNDKAKHLYNVIITAHGLIMIFYMLMPLLINGLGCLTLPRMLKTEALAFPKVGVVAFWSFLTSLVIALSSLIAWGTTTERGIATGWTLYPPLSSKIYHNGPAVDLAIISICLTCVSSLLTAFNFAVTTLCFRNVKVKLTKMPLLAWGLLISSLLLMITMPVLIVSLVMLLLDRNLGTVFYDPNGGGDPTLFQHLFWFFGHPEVYALILPAFGIISEIVSRFAFKPIFGKIGMILSMVIIAVIGITVWAHHMYTVGLSFSSLKYFVVATTAVAIPTGVKVLSWLSTIWNGSIELSPPMVWAIAFIVLFITGGVTGVQLANASLSNMLHDTYYVVAHFHYVLALAAVFGALAAWYYWFPKIMGIAYNEVHGISHAIITFVITNLIFLPQHFLGLAGMPRRCVDYPLAFKGWNRISSVASVSVIIVIILFLYINLQALRAGNRCPIDPWKRKDKLEGMKSC
ncbi:MAG: cbb3-type cytochrome c oxidase subunit I [Candidatus Hodgkinia cicadicola]